MAKRKSKGAHSVSSPRAEEQRPAPAGWLQIGTKYIRAVLLVPILLAAATVMDLGYWVWAVAVYLALIIWFLSVFDQELKPIIRTGIGIAALAVIVMFTKYLVFAPSKLTIERGEDIADYAAGQVVDGISWKDFYSDYRLTFTNHADIDISDLDVSINTDMLIQEKGFEPDGPSAFFYESGEHVEGRFHDPENPSAQGQLVARGVSGKTRFRCPQFPAHSWLVIVMAMVMPPDELANPPTKITEHMNYPKRLPRRVIVKVRYTIRERPYILRFDENSIPLIGKEPIAPAGNR
jgi:hypothetical protein